MNILFLSSEYNHPNLPASGGVGTFIKIIAHELSKRGHTVHVFGFNRKQLEFKDKDVNLYFARKFSKKRWMIKFYMSASRKLKFEKLFCKFLKLEYKFWASELKKYAKGKDLNIIEAWDYGGHFMNLNKLDIPVVVRCHGSAGVLNHYFGYPYLKNLSNFEKLAFKDYNNIIAVSRFTKRINEEWFNKKNIHVIHNGIDLKQFSNTYNRKDVINQSIFYFGTLSERKGVYDLAEVFNNITTKFPNATLHLIGKGKDIFEHIEENILTEKSLKNTTYYGSLQHNELAILLRKAHTIVFPTKGENFPFAFLEAMATEKPIVTSNIEVSSEIINHNTNGLIAGSIEEYVTHISKIFTDLEYANTLALNARKTIEDHFTVELMAEKSIEYYTKVINDY